VNLKRLGTVLWLAHEQRPENFEEFLLLKDVGPRAVQSLALVSEVIHGSPSRFKDPVRFSFAHGGKDGHPFPVALKVYDETIRVLQTAVNKSKLGNIEKTDAIKKMHEIGVRVEKDFTADKSGAAFETLIQKERDDSWKYGGKTVFGDAKPPRKNKGVQLRMF
jgi:hypothetical protein